MTNEDDPTPSPDESAHDVDALFAELAASMPELAAIDGPDSGLVDVVVVIPDPAGGPPTARLTIGVPAGLAPVLQREFAPDRIVAMMSAVSAMVAQARPPEE